MTIRPLHIVHTEASCGWGGQEIRILTESAGLQQRGHKVTLLCPGESHIHDAAKERGLAVFALPIGRKNIRGIRAIYSWLKHNPVDIINTHSSTDSWLTAIACQLLPQSPKIIRTRHISAPVINRPTTRWLYNKASSYIVTTGERLRRQLIQSIGIDENHIVSIPTGVDSDQFQPGDSQYAKQRLSLPSHALCIGIIATLRSWKGHQYLIDALASLDRKNLHLVIVGDGPVQKMLEKQVERLGLTKDVTFAGRQSDVVPWLHSLDIFALPSYANEGVPQSLIQAMMCALPVISTDVGSITELVKHNVNGLIVPAKDSNSLADALNQLLTDRNLRESLAREGRKTALADFKLEDMLDRMEQLFSDQCK